MQRLLETKMVTNGILAMGLKTVNPDTSLAAGLKERESARVRDCEYDCKCEYEYCGKWQCSTTPTTTAMMMTTTTTTVSSGGSGWCWDCGSYAKSAWCAQSDEFLMNLFNSGQAGLAGQRDSQSLEAPRLWSLQEPSRSNSKCPMPDACCLVPGAWCCARARASFIFEVLAQLGCCVDLWMTGRDDYDDAWAELSCVQGVFYHLFWAVPAASSGAVAVTSKSSSSATPASSMSGLVSSNANNGSFTWATLTSSQQPTAKQPASNS